MHRPDVCTAAAEPAPTSPSAPSQQPNPHMVTVPASIQRFYVHFMTSLSRPSRPGSAAAPTKTAVSVSSTPSQYRGASTVPDQDSTQDEALCRLTAVQEATLGPLLWQWLGLFSLAVRRQEAAPREGLPGPSAIAAPPTMRQELRSCLLRPHHVERLFHIGFTSLLPVAASSGAGGGVSGSRWSPVDPPAPWHGVRPTEYSPPESVLVSALSGLNQYGPLFSAWCALCYTCIDTLLVSRVTSQGNREGQNAAADPCEVDFHEAEEAIRSALRCLLHAWDSAVALPGAWSGESSISDTSVARKNADAWATATLWRTVYETCATSHSSTTAAPSVHEGRGRETSKPLAPPLPMLLWSAQWHRECTRIAAHGTDDVFDTEDAGVPVELMTRVMHYMCHRLKTEVMRCARWHDSGKMATPSTATVGLEEMHAKAAAPPLPSLPAETDASVTCAPSLRIGTLTALALQCPMNPVGNEADRRSGTAKRPRSRRGGVPCRRRRRSWHVSLSSTDDDTDSSEGNGSECSGTSRFLLRQRVLFQVDIACGVLTTFSMCPADSGIAQVPLPPQRQSGADVSRKPAQPADQCYIPFLTSERCLRNGTVHWWTLSDSQRHRQLMAEGRSTTW
ncbi:hypothetical protein JKF63_06928 [Porcisia hertigi]|uniref:Uncharacterized protein n=1 Tax=Porcisia hertigi TaxID=2761500 RepID=A0A837AXY7_9TRYP|nr:hypothetical protein JKF63_06928 [Porcisia hertigi]